MTVRQRLRLGRHLFEAWQSRAGPHPSEGEWERLELMFRRALHSRHRYELAREAGFTFIQSNLRSELLASLVSLDQHVNLLREQAYRRVEQDDPSTQLTLSHWFMELGQIEDEFDDVMADIKKCTLTVRTESITFKDVQLGRFEIVFCWSRITTLTGSRCFDVIAVDPNPARGKEGVIHPHVRDDEVCAGDAGRTLEEAVREGRLADAFLLMNSVLTTYNARSPYVPIDDWDGSTCSECGGSIDPDYRNSCDACSAELCDGCIRSCTACEDYRCPTCLQLCDGCHNGCCPGCLTTFESDKSYCRDCIDPCSKCNLPTPKEDLTAHDQLCPTCLESEENDEATSLEATPAASP